MVRGTSENAVVGYPFAAIRMRLTDDDIPGLTAPVFSSEGLKKGAAIDRVLEDFDVLFIGGVDAHSMPETFKVCARLLAKEDEGADVRTRLNVRSVKPDDMSARASAVGVSGDAYDAWRSSVLADLGSNSVG